MGDSSNRTRTRTCKRVRNSDYVYDFDAVLDELEEEEEAFFLVEAREEDEEEERGQKRSKKTQEPLFDLIPPEILSKIYSYMDDPRDVFNLSLCSKACRKVVTSTIVIRAAVFAKDSRTQRAITSVMEKLQLRAIHTPSTFRLLRLVLGTRCERMEECYKYNVVSKKPNVVSKTPRLPYGLCICDECDKMIATSRVVKNWNSPLLHERLVTSGWGRVLLQPHFERATGEVAGPLVLGKEVNQIRVSYPSNEQKQAMNELFEDVDKNQSESDKAKVEKLVDAYQTALADRNNSDKKQNRRDYEQWTARRDEKAARKREMGQPVFASIVELLDGYQHEEIAVDGTWNETSGIFEFRHCLSRELLGPLLSAPSSASQTRVQSKIQELRDGYDLILGSGFGTGLAPDFLSCLAESESPHERAIYNYRYDLTWANHLISRECLEHGYGLTFVNTLREQGAFAAIFSHLEWEDKQEAFLESVAEEGMSERMASWYRLLAKAVWGERLRFRHWGQGHMGGDDAGTIESYKAKFEDKVSTYDILSSAMKSYLCNRQVRKFLGKRGPPPNSPDQTFTRHSALKRLFQLKQGSRELLEQENFKELLRLHEAIFCYPNNFAD